jgi:hypothetical protein
VKGSGELLERVNSVNTKAAVSYMAAILRCHEAIVDSRNAN